MIVGIREVKMHGGHLARVHIDLRFGRREMPAPTAVDGGQELDRDLAGDIDTSAADRNGFVGNSSIQAQCVAKLVVQRHGRKTETDHPNKTEERRVGKEGVMKCRSRGSAYH